MAVNTQAAPVALSRPRALRWIAPALISVVCFAIGAGAMYMLMAGRRVADRARANAFELNIGGEKYLITEDKPFSVVAADGKTVEGLLRRKNRLKFESDGVLFAYPSTMRVRGHSDGGHLNVAVDCMDSPEFILNAYDKPASLEAASSTFEQEMAKGMKEAGAEIVDGSEKPATRKFHGIDRTGKAADYELHGITVHQEIYAFETDRKVYTMVLQYHTQEADLAKRYFEVILETLE